MLNRLWSLISKQTAPQSSNASPYFRASVGRISGGMGADARAAYNAAAAVKRCRSWVYAASQINAFGVSSVPLRLYVRAGSGGRKLYRTAAVERERRGYLLGDSVRTPSRTVVTKLHDFGADFEEVTESHPVLDLLRKVNPQLNGFDLAATRTLWQELTGNAYVHVVRNNLGVPAELWPMPPQWVEIVPDETKFIKEYLYGRDSNSRISLSPDEVIHFKRPNPDSLFYGLGKVEAAWNVIELNEANHVMDLALSRNNARPDWLATVQNTDASEEAIAEFERAVNERLQGPHNRGRFIALTGQVDLKPMQFAPKDMVGRDEVVEEIAAVFGVPVSMLKANDPNLASATTGFAQWRESTILPLLRLDEETLNQRLLPMFGIEDEAVLAYDDPVPANRQMDLSEHTGLISVGAMTLNEVREARGLDPLDEPAAGVPIIGGIPLVGVDVDPAPISTPAPGPSTTEPATPAPAATPAPEPAAAPLNGAQIQAAQEVLLAVTAGSIAPAAAEALLVALGLSASSASVMVAAQSAIVPANVTPVPESTVAGPAPTPPAKSRKAVTADAPERYAEIDFKPTAEMSDAAARGLRLREEFNRGGTEVGVARAVQLSNRETLSPETVRRMHSYFARHAVDRRPGWDSESDPSAGFIAWLLWGGDPGRDWAERVVERMARADEEKSAAACGCEEHLDASGKVLQSKLLSVEMPVTKAPFANRAEERIIRRLERELGRIGREQIRDVIRELKASGMIGEELVDAALVTLRDEIIVTETAERVQPFLREAIGLGFDDGRDGVEDAIARITGGVLPESISWDEEPVTDWSKSRALDVANDLGKSTSVAVETVLRPLVDAGATVDEMADALESEGFNPARARTVARTETSRAMNRGTVEAWKQSAVVRGKRWLANPQACPFCQSISDRGEVKSIDQDFLQVGDSVTSSDGKQFVVDYDAVQGPPLHPNCRCTLIPVLESEQ